MSEPFLDALCEAVAGCTVVDRGQRHLIGRAIADTLGVAAAGFAEPVTRKVLAAYRGEAAETWSGVRCESPEAAVLINAVAAHALDFDDVYLESLAHISAVLLPIVLQEVEDDPEDVLSAFGAGLIAAKALARRVGPGHYRKGWHSTATIGAFAAAAAAGRLNRLQPSQLASAFALVASMSGGLRVNFSTEAKLAHAGFAAAAGMRAARLAAAGVTGSRDVFSERGYPRLYGTGDGDAAVAPETFELRPDRISIKLYPCCYAAHRLIGITLEAMASVTPEPGMRWVFTVPAGSLDAIENADPKDGLEAKFSARYCVATTLLDGPPHLASFTDEAVARKEVRALMGAVELVEDPAQQCGGDIAAGEVRLDVIAGDGSPKTFFRTALPGSPRDPPSKAALRRKLAACLASFEAEFGRDFPALRRAGPLGVGSWLTAQSAGESSAKWNVACCAEAK